MMSSADRTVMETVELMEKNYVIPTALGERDNLNPRVLPAQQQNYLRTLVSYLFTVISWKQEIFF